MEDFSTVRCISHTSPGGRPDIGRLIYWRHVLDIHRSLLLAHNAFLSPHDGSWLLSSCSSLTETNTTRSRFPPILSNTRTYTHIHLNVRLRTITWPYLLHKSMHCFCSYAKNKTKQKKKREKFREKQSNPCPERMRQIQDRSNLRGL